MEEKGNKVTSHVAKGLVLAAVLIAYAIAGQIFHFTAASWFLLVWVLILGAGVIWGIINYSVQMRGKVSFASLFPYGLKLTAVVTCIYFVFSLLQIYVIFPGYLDEIVNQSIIQASKNGTIDKEKLAENMGQARKVTAAVLLAGVVMGTMIAGMLASLAGSALAKKNPGV